MTNRGLHISLPIAHCGNELYAASINCPSPPNYKDSVFLATFLKRLSQVDVQYVRVKVGELNNTYHQGPPQTIYVRQTIPAPEVDGEFPTHAMRIRSMPSLVGCRVKTTILKSAVWSDRDSIASPRTFMGYRIKKGTNDVAAFVVFTIHNGPGVLLALGSAQRFDVAFDAFETRHPDDFTNKDFKQLDGVFEPKKPGAWVVLKDYRSSLEGRLTAAKYFLVDIKIERVPESSEPMQGSAHAVQIVKPAQKRKFTPERPRTTRPDGEKPERRKRGVIKQIFGE